MPETDHSSNPASSPIDIRPGTIDDAAEIDRLLRILAHGLGELERHQSTAASIGRDGFGRPPRFSTLLAWPNDRRSNSAGSEGVTGSIDSEGAVGACVYLPDYSTTRACSGVYILDLVVVPGWQGKGVGLELLRAAAAVGRDQWRADYLILSVAHQNDGARRFYARHGMQIDDKSHVMTLDGLDSLLEA